MDYKNATNGAFKGLRAAANYFGLVSYSSDQFLSVDDDWIAAFHDGSEDGLRRLRREAVVRPELYRQLVDEFSDRQLPNVEKLARQLHLGPKYGILKDAADNAARAFLDSVRFAGIVDTNNFLRPTEAPPESSRPEATDSTPSDAGVHIVKPAMVRDAEAVSFAPLPTESLDRIEVLLLGGRRAYLFVPVPLRPREKERLKKYIDLVLEPEEHEGVQD